MIRLVSNPSIKEKYTVEQTGIFCNVFTMLKDKSLDLVWVGTDGRRLIQLRKSSYNFHSFNIERINPRISSPVRASFIDKDGNLWLGMKGEGILRIRGFDNGLQEQELVSEHLNEESESSAAIMSIHSQRVAGILSGSDVTAATFIGTPIRITGFTP